MVPSSEAFCERKTFSVCHKKELDGVVVVVVVLYTYVRSSTYQAIGHTKTDRLDIDELERWKTKKVFPLFPSLFSGQIYSS